MEIVQLLTQQLGITQEQAKGGAGLLFQQAKEKLGADDFGQVADAVPGMNEILGAAPEPEGAAGALGGLMSKFGADANQLGSLAGLAAGFKSLGLDAGMIGKFVPVILSYVKSKGGDTVKDLLDGVLS
jgi:hypothetical protein